ASLDPRVAVGQHGWWQECRELHQPGYGWCSPSNAGQKWWDYNIVDDQGFSATRFTQSITRVALPGAEYLDRRNAEHLKRYMLKRLARLAVTVTVKPIESTAALPS